MSDPEHGSFAELWHRVRWPVSITLVVLVIAGARYEGTQHLTATVLALGVPLGVIAFGILPLGDSERPLRLAGIAVGVTALLLAEAEIGHLFFPPPPLAQATLSEKSPDATLDGVEGRGEFELESSGSLGTFKGSAEEKFVLDVERAGAHRQIEGAFSKSSATRVSRRRTPTQSSSHAIDDDRQFLSLPGAGPIHAHLVQLSGTGPRSLKLSLRPTLPGGRLLEWLLELAVVLAVVVQAAAARQGARTQFAAFIGIAGVLALYLPHHFSASDPLGATFGGLIVALLVGGLGGYFIGSVASRLAGRRDANSA